MILRIPLAILVFHWVGAFFHTPASDPYSTRSDTPYRIVHTMRPTGLEREFIASAGKLALQEFSPVDDEYETDQNEELTVGPPGVMENDTVELGVVAVLVDSPLHGDVVFGADGSFSYTPTLDFVGIDEFTYQLELEDVVSGLAVVQITVVDTQPPDVIWISPVLEGDVLVVGFESILLEVEATDNSLLDGVLFYRWDPVLDDYVDISFVEAAPFQYVLFTGDLHSEWNQLFVRAMDEAGNASDRSWIWIYLAPRVYFPMLFNSDVVMETDLTD